MPLAGRGRCPAHDVPVDGPLGPLRHQPARPPPPRALLRGLGIRALVPARPRVAAGLPNLGPRSRGAEARCGSIIVAASTALLQSRMTLCRRLMPLPLCLPLSPYPAETTPSSPLSLLKHHLRRQATWCLCPQTPSSADLCGPSLRGSPLRLVFLALPRALAAAGAVGTCSPPASCA